MQRSTIPKALPGTLMSGVASDKETGETFGRIAAALDGAGIPSAHRTQDLWIAAVAVQHNLKVLTRNRRDFEGIPGLDILVI